MAQSEAGTSGRATTGASCGTPNHKRSWRGVVGRATAEPTAIPLSPLSLPARTLTLEQQLRSKSAEATSADTRVKALTRELAEERKAASAAAAAARATAAAQLDAAIRQAGGAEEAAAAASERAAELEGR